MKGMPLLLKGPGKTGIAGPAKLYLAVSVTVCLLHNYCTVKVVS
jgi:hypothetical protein